MPPPDFTPETGLNEVRAGSGPLTLTCRVEEANGKVNYTWDSSLYSVDGVPEQRSTAFLYSEHTGMHTCTATDEGNNSGSATTVIKVVGKKCLPKVRIIICMHDHTINVTMFYQYRC